MDCDGGDHGALASLRPEMRKTWLARHPLPREVPYYSIVAMPAPARVSTGLKPSCRLLSDIDPRNDGNLLFYDQVIPASTLLGYANADHWAIATDLTQSPAALVRSVADRNAFPRAALLEAALRYVEEDLRDGPGR